MLRCKPFGGPSDAIICSLSANIMDRGTENGCQETRVELMEQENPLTKHGHLLKSGPLGRCDNPYCTTCPSYFTSNGPSVSQPSPMKNAFFGGAKSMHVKLVGWSKDWFPSVLNPHTKIVQRWNQFFVISCLFAIFVDPLFFFLFSVRQKTLCEDIFHEFFLDNQWIAYKSNASNML
eukprot:Gb_35450 [translate_table: standard]